MKGTTTWQVSELNTFDLKYAQELSSSNDLDQYTDHTRYSKQDMMLYYVLLWLIGTINLKGHARSEDGDA